MTAPVERPPHVDRARWYDPRTPWYARQKASDEWKRQFRPVEVTYESHTGRRGSPCKLTTDELAEQVRPLLERGMTAKDAASEVGMRVDAIEQRFRKAGLKDLQEPFRKARDDARKRPCADCGVPCFKTRCRSCAMKHHASDPAERERRRLLAIERNNGSGRFKAKGAT